MKKRCQTKTVLFGSDIPLQRALLIAQEYHAVLRIEGSEIVIWGSLPIQARTVILSRKETVYRLIRQSHIAVCPSPELHKHSWAYVVRRDCCQICARLNYWLGKVDKEKCCA